MPPCHGIWEFLVLRLGLYLGTWGVGGAEIQREEPLRTYVSIGVEHGAPRKLCRPFQTLPESRGPFAQWPAHT